MKNILGKRFGMLEPIEPLYSNKNKNWVWLCVCLCGNLKEVSCAALHARNNRSCGCLRVIHNLSKTAIFSRWSSMMDRCYNKKNKSYKNYGGRGIKVHKAWHNVQCFYNDIGEPPSTEHSIDRIDVNKEYGPDNCRWALPCEQANNRQNTLFFSYNDRRMALAEWVFLYERNYTDVYQKMFRDGKTFKEAMRF